MSDWPVGLSTGCFWRSSIFDCLEPIRNAGFDMIEVCSVPSHLDYHDKQSVEKAAQRIRSLWLEAFSLHAPFADHLDITSPDESQRNRALREILAAAEAAAILGVRYYVIHPGPERGQLPEDERMKRMENAASVMNQVARRCQDLHVSLVLENMLPHLFSGHVKDLLWLLGALDMTDVGICLDTGHAHLSGDLPTVTHKLSGHLWMVHVNDTRGQFDDHLPPGEGKINWDRLLHQLAEIGFRGAFILEMADTGSPEEILANAMRGRRYLRQISRLL